MATRPDNSRRDDAAEALAAQLRGRENRRFLGAMALFKASNDDTMERFSSQLARLDRAQKRQSGRD